MTQPPPSLPRLRVVVADENAMSARLIAQAAEDVGFECLAVVDTPEEIDPFINELQLAVVSADFGEASGGIQLAASLRDRADIPTLFVTGHSLDEIESELLTVRPVGLLRKPFGRAEIATQLLAIAESRRPQQDSLQSKLASLRGVLDGVDQPIVVSDLDQRIVHINRFAIEKLGVDLEEVQGVPFSEFWDSQDTEGRMSVTVSALRDLHGHRLGQMHAVSFAEEDLSRVDEESGLDDEMPKSRSAALDVLRELSQNPSVNKLLAPGGGVAVEAKPAPESAPAPAPGSEEAASSDGIWIRISVDLLILGSSAEAQKAFPAIQREGVFSLGDFFFSIGWSATLPKVEKWVRHGGDDFSGGDLHDGERGQWYRLSGEREGRVYVIHLESITAEKIEDLEKRRAERLEGLGLLARGFAHDFNNHLTTLTGTISLAREMHLEDAELHDLLTDAQKAASRAGNLVQQLMTFSRGGEPVRVRTSIESIIRSLLTDYRLRMPDIRFQFRRSDHEVFAKVDPSQIKRVLDNLIENAVDALPKDQGVILVGCKRVSATDLMADQGGLLSREDYFLIEVIDSGEGISAENLPKVFDPYYTTRKDRNASGIGLTVCESIAKAHGGFVRLQSKVGKGTIATFGAPLGFLTEEDHAGFAGDPPSMPEIEHKILELSMESPGRILVLEDEASIRRLIAATLRRAGYEVVETSDGADTVRLFQQARDENAPFRLVICDLTIERGLGGVEAMQAIREMDPHVRSIVSSGYSDAPAMARPREFGFTEVLPKPYAPSELKALVHRVLEDS